MYDRNRAFTRAARIVVGVSGGIAAYKACTVVRQLSEAGHSVRVIPTESALRFVGAATFEALSGQPVHTGVFNDVPEVPHVQLGKQADLVVVAPATADLLARAVHGRADDLLTATLLTARCPVLFAPAMHTEMWLHPATVDNVATLRRRARWCSSPPPGASPGRTAGRAGCPKPRRSPPWPTCCWNATTRCPTTSPAARCWSPPAAPANRSTRCASSATAALASRAMPWRGWRPSAAPRSP
ncbi:flavofamily protein [Mycobacterium avium subsp. avium 2285 (R)]|nr:flavofamily protein [Mycobacterium avium subsp. avium 2285 (R)]